MQSQARALGPFDALPLDAEELVEKKRPVLFRDTDAVSATAITTSPPERLPVTATLPPGLLYLMALAIRLSNRTFRQFRSPDTHNASSGQTASSETCSAAAISS